MLRYLFATCAALVVAQVHAQGYWSTDVGGAGNDHVRDVKVDAAGNIYATGEFSGSIQFGSSTYVSNAGIDMFLAKLSPGGQVLWFVQGGGAGIDGGIKLAVRGGSVAVVGTFMHTATFQGQSLTSAGAQDIFMALHDAATGTLQWIVGGGGLTASDRPYGVTIASTGAITMVGEFSDTVQVAGDVFSSMVDPQTGVPSVDVFIATYSPSGTPLWTLQGAAKYTDRAIDVVNDAADNIYVTGQFSDTIQFATAYPNAMYNASFLLKLDPLGHEQWFRRMGGAVYNQVRDMQWASSEELLVVGDVQGNMAFLDSVPDFIASGDPYGYYVLRVNPNGQLVSDTVVSSLHAVSGRAVDERDGLVTVLGEFKCQFTAMVDSLHTGLWMATGIQDLFVVQHALDSLSSIKGAQQFGGRQEKLAGQVASLIDGSPIFCGSFEDMLVFPCQGSFAADIASNFPPYGLMAPNLSGYCNDEHYGSFAADTSNGLKDGFIARGFVPGRSPYDWWDRNETDCSFGTLGLCLGEGDVPVSCADTVGFCGPGYIGIKPEFAFSIDHREFFIGPELNFLWSNGQTTDSLKVSASANHAVTCTTINGCLQWTDTIHVEVHPFPPQPLLSDDIPVATDSPNVYQIHLCDPEDVWLWCSNVDTTATTYWGSFSDPVVNDSLLVDTSGVYRFNMVNVHGCASQNSVVVIDHPNVPIPDVELSMVLTYPQDVDLNDTLELCPMQEAYIRVSPTWELDGLPYYFPYTDPPTFYFGYVINGDTTYLDSPELMHGFMPSGDGWYRHIISMLIVNSPCGTDTLTLSNVVVDSIYIRMFPSVDVTAWITGPALICPSDTALLVGHCINCDALDWQGTGIISMVGDSVYGGAGVYEVTASVVDSNGCSFDDYAYLHVVYPGVPELDVIPPEGIICPDSIATVYTHALGSYTWYGPEGEIPIDNDSIPVTIAGEYYLALTDPNECYLISDPILITGYATPFLLVSPDNVLCLGEAPITIQVATTGHTSFAWAAPHTGSGLTVEVDQPGVYSCTVQACGITTQLSVEVVVGTAVAEVANPGPFVLCPGDTVPLFSTSTGMSVWEPGHVVADTLLVSHAGNYTLTVVDGHGCADTAQAVVVDMYDFGGPLTLTDLVVCAGSPVTLHETAPGTYTWYADSTLTDMVGTGAVLDLGVPDGNLTVYLVRGDTACIGLPVPISVTVEVPPPVYLADEPLVACTGDTLLLVAGIGSPYTVAWSTPSGAATGDTIALGPLDSLHGGWYAAAATAQGCSGMADSVHITVWQPALFNLGPDTSFCPGESVTFWPPTSFSNTVWQGSIHATNYTAHQTGVVYVSAVDQHGCPVQDTVQVVELSPQLPVSANDAEVCLGHDALLVASGSGSLSWYSDPALQVPFGTGPTLLISAPMDSLVLYLVQEEDGCTTGPVAIAVNVVPIPVDVTMTGTTPLCIGQPAVLQATGPVGMQGTWSTPTGPRTGAELAFTSITAADGGWYVLEPSLGGCIGPLDSILLAPLVPLSIALVSDSIVCRGGELLITMSQGFTDPLWSTGAETSAITVHQGGTYSVTATDVNGCLSTAQVVVVEVDCEVLLPNVITPNGDGINDGFDVGAVGAVGAWVVIYNRWGHKVHEGDLLTRPWKGQHHKSGEPVPDGEYYYVLRLDDNEGNTSDHTGSFTLRR